MNEIDNALTMAETISLLDDGDPTQEFLYENMRQSLSFALEKARALEEREPQMALEWALAHLIPAATLASGIYVEVNPIRKDPALSNWAEIGDRARWLLSSQGERLTAAAAVMRTATGRAMTGAVSRKELLEWLKDDENSTSQGRANKVDRSKVLVEVAPGMYSASSVAFFKAENKPVIKRRPKDNYDEYLE